MPLIPRAVNPNRYFDAVLGVANSILRNLRAECVTPVITMAEVAQS